MHLPNERPPHPLAVAVAGCNLDEPALLAGIGNGRHIPVLADRGRLIFAVDESETLVSHFSKQSTPYLIVRLSVNGELPIPDVAIGVILATHMLQHGTRRSMQIMLHEFARVAKCGAEAALVFASTADARYGHGRYIEPQCYAPLDGDERGIAHLYLTPEQVREALADYFTVDSVEHIDADEIVGTWAHERPRGLRHIFVRARRNTRAFEATQH